MPVMGWLIVIDYKTLEILLGGDALFFLEWGVGPSIHLELFFMQ